MGKKLYRVRAIAFGNKKSRTSREIKVVLPGHSTVSGEVYYRVVYFVGAHHWGKPSGYAVFIAQALTLFCNTFVFIRLNEHSLRLLELTN